MKMKNEPGAAASVAAPGFTTVFMVGPREAAAEAAYPGAAAFEVISVGFWYVFVSILFFFV